MVEDTSYGGCSWAKVKEQMDTFVQNPTFCRELGVPTPDELWALLDNDPYLLGFDDGVYSFRDWRFYKKGEVPSSFATSMSCGYDFPGDENGDVPPELASAVADFERDTIHKLTEGDLETRAQVKDMLGSELIGDPALFKVVPVVVGPGDNGKSVFSEGADASMGGYAGGFGRGTFYNQIESNLLRKQKRAAKKPAAAAKTTANVVDVAKKKKKKKKADSEDEDYIPAEDEPDDCDTEAPQTQPVMAADPAPGFMATRWIRTQLVWGFDGGRPGHEVDEEVAGE